LGERTFDIDRVALAGIWNGEYLAIWPAPDALETRYAAGDADAVAWVRERLSRESVNPRANANAFVKASDRDAALRAFQAQYGLASDGRLRAETMFALAARGDGPRLANSGSIEAVE
jgi:general secretion pathway protein A